MLVYSKIEKWSNKKKQEIGQLQQNEKSLAQQGVAAEADKTPPR